MWWKNFFDKKYKKYLKNTYPDTLTEADLKLIKKFINKKSVILDLACGYGRLFIPLKENGYKVFGLDYSLEMTTELRKNRRYNKFIKIGDMRKKNFNDGFFNLIFCLFSSFGYFDNSYEDFKVLVRAADSLKRNGVFILDLRNTLETKREKMSKRIDGETRFYYINRYSLDETKKMIKAAGFKIINIYGDQMLAKYSQQSRRMIIVMKKS